MQNIQYIWWWNRKTICEIKFSEGRSFHKSSLFQQTQYLDRYVLDNTNVNRNTSRRYPLRTLHWNHTHSTPSSVPNDDVTAFRICQNIDFSNNKGTSGAHWRSGVTACCHSSVKIRRVWPANGRPKYRTRDYSAGNGPASQRLLIACWLAEIRSANSSQYSCFCSGPI